MKRRNALAALSVLLGVIGFASMRCCRWPSGGC
jgi:hypothetical protein